MSNVSGLAKWLRLALSGTDLVPFGQSLLQRAADDPHDSAALLDASIVLQCLGNLDMGLQLQREAFSQQRLYRIPARTSPARLRLLALMAPGAIMANVPVECLLDGSDIELDLYYVSPAVPDPAKLPAHDLLFVAIGESEANRPLLEAWAPRLRDWPCPVLNDPRRILDVARDWAGRRLQGQSGLVVPLTVRLDRGQLQALASGEGGSGLDVPWLVRPLDSHAGQGLTKVDRPEALLSLLDAQSSQTFFVSPFVDYRRPDGRFRKFRVVLIDGLPFAVHMGISDHWMIHYLNAGMDDSAAKRAEEAEFMANFERDFARRHAEALAAIQATFGLDYLGIDCAETADGRLLIFEVDPAMVVHDMDPIDLYPYKPAAMHRIFAAFRALLITAAECRSPGLPPDA
ncbi:ATP-grasp domain-containing protein [Allochromatium palmeri]|uniref:RimK family alpha-L-glutamate ligase n=1 Tax=Allochromatium palmeri TaxID=231048 RepID=A0A6N8EBB9_9GAMM|nr:RimK family alpha-L-glutamate ligase [Allochromatium palmeri]MTW20648.1 RimK family alpha-L-glutamate ligase [Allochromatium palmeri]